MGTGACYNVRWNKYLEIMSAINSDAAAKLKEDSTNLRGDAKFCIGPEGDGSILFTPANIVDPISNILSFNEDGSINTLGGQKVAATDPLFMRYFIAGIFGNEELKTKLEGGDLIALKLLQTQAQQSAIDQKQEPEEISTSQDGQNADVRNTVTDEEDCEVNENDEYVGDHENCHKSITVSDGKNSFGQSSTLGSNEITNGISSTGYMTHRVNNNRMEYAVGAGVGLELDGVPLAPGFAFIETDLEILHQPVHPFSLRGYSDNNWFFTNNVRGGLYGAIDGLHLLADVVSVGAHMTAEGRTIGSGLELKKYFNFGGGPSLGIYPIKPEKSNDLMLRIDAEPANFAFTIGADVLHYALSGGGISDWRRTSYNPRLAALLMHRPTGLGLGISVAGNISLAGSYKYTYEESHENSDGETINTTITRDEKLIHNGVDLRIEGFWAPFFSMKNAARGITLYTRYDREHVKTDHTPSTININSIIFGLKYQIGWSDEDEDKHDTAERDAVFNRM